jgi:hypothetical protein
MPGSSISGGRGGYDNLAAPTEAHPSTSLTAVPEHGVAGEYSILAEELVEAKLVTSAVSDSQALEHVIMETIMKNSVKAQHVESVSEAVPQKKKRFKGIRKFFKPWKR